LPTATTAFSGIQNNHWAESPDPTKPSFLAYNKQPEEDGKLVSVVSWILPITKKTRESNREQIKLRKYWAYTKWYGEKFNSALRKYMVDTFKIRAI